MIYQDLTDQGAISQFVGESSEILRRCLSSFKILFINWLHLTR